jgi:8-oxo-dGTP pyrophosphatase MutT (NUDIX family)
MIRLSTAIAVVTAGSFFNQNNKTTAPLATALCAEETENKIPIVSLPRNVESLSSLREELFPSHMFDFDHYNGVTMDLDGLEEDIDVFYNRLRQQLQQWKQEGVIRGVWMHIPPHRAQYVPALSCLGFDFHMVSPPTDASIPTREDDIPGRSKNVLIMSQWLPESPSRLPGGPSHQVGIGCVVWHPLDQVGIVNPGDRRLLVVQEKTGPAAAWKLWKLPTGLADPNEDIHEAATRELEEETGLHASFDGLLLVRQAHPTTTPVAVKLATEGKDTLGTDRSRVVKAASVKRKTSDLFFICQMTLQPLRMDDSEYGASNDEDFYSDQLWKACPQEIAAIQWMSVQDYCNQSRWQSSPVYQALNQAILESASGLPWHATTLPLWVDPKDNRMELNDSTHVNTFYSSNTGIQK